MRSVEADDVIPERQPWQSPTRVAINLGMLVVVWVVVFVVPRPFHISFGALVALAVALTVIVVAVDVLRYRRQGRA